MERFAKNSQMCGNALAEIAKRIRSCFLDKMEENVSLCESTHYSYFVNANHLRDIIKRNNDVDGVTDEDFLNMLNSTEV